MMDAGKLPAQTETIEHASAQHDQHALEFEPPAQHVQELNEAEHINLSWRSWLVVFVTCFAIMAQVFVVVAAGSVIAFIIRDLGDPSIAGWIIRELLRGVGDMLLTFRRGATADAECAVTYRRTTE